MLVFPEVPEALEGLTDEALAALRDGLLDALGVVTKGTFTPSTAEDLAQVSAATEGLSRVRAEIKDRKSKAAEHQAVLAAAAAALQDDEESEEEAEEGAEEGEESEDDAEDDAEDEAEEPEVKATSKVPAVAKKVRAGVGTKDLPKSKTIQPGHLTAMDNVPNYAPGAQFETWTDFAQALMDRAATAGSSQDLTPVGRIKGVYPKDRILSDDPLFNLGTFDRPWGQGTLEEMTATMCAPCTPYYNLTCMNTTRRPVFNSLPQFAAPRGCVSIYPSPSLSDITGGEGLWDNTNDDGIQSKAACQTIACATPTEYRIYGVYRCLTVQNLLQLTFPELVEAYLNRLAAASARRAEKQLLDLMGASAGTILGGGGGFGLDANISLTTQILRYITGYQERQRWDFDTSEMWAPRWLLAGMRMSWAMRKNFNGGAPSVPTEAQVNAMFNDVGVTPHWFIDTPTWGVAAPVQSTPAVNQSHGLVAMPTHVKVLMAPPGKLALMDRGELRVGVTGNNIYRDNTSNTHNNFTFFFETFEGIVNTNSCPADILDLPVCFNGVQVADEEVDCAGAGFGPS